MTTIALAGAQQRLVDVVMKDPSEPLPIFAAQVARQRLSLRLNLGLVGFGDHQFAGFGGDLPHSGDRLA